MKQFKGPKYQQGKVGGFKKEKSTYDLAKDLMRHASATKIYLNGECTLYLELDDFIMDYPTEEQEKIIGYIKDAFKTVQPKYSIAVGTADLTAYAIPKRKAFAEKLIGSIQ